MALGLARAVMMLLLVSSGARGAWATDVAATRAPGDQAEAVTAGKDGDGAGPRDTSNPHVLGIKASAVGVRTSEHPYMSIASLGFDARLEFGRSVGFFELGAAVLLPMLPPLDDHGTPHEDVLDYGGLGGDIGANLYLARGIIRPYVGIGVLPRWLLYTGPASEMAHTFAFGFYGQVGVMLAAGASTRTYVDLRVANAGQCFDRMKREGGPTSVTNEWMRTSCSKICPTEVALAVGVGW